MMEGARDALVAVGFLWFAWTQVVSSAYSVEWRERGSGNLNQVNLDVSSSVNASAAANSNGSLSDSDPGSLNSN